MIDVRVFQMLGFLVEPGFLARADCVRLRSEMSRASAEAAGVVHEGQNVVDRGHRSTKRVGVGDGAYRDMEQRLAAMRPQLERHFRVTLSGMQEPQFLRYTAGDFFRCHADTSDHETAPDFLRQRKISTVIFLGHPEEDGHEAACGHGRGGDLVFHGLIDDQRMRDRGFAFPPEEGTFVAFPSTVLHEVTTVTGGHRYSVVTWFY
jgi:predicted 2-oxoglutarate/Fe(II)-dependent dioxygenase YbiX